MITNYPDILSVGLGEIPCGVHVGLREVVIDPFGTTSFDLRLGRFRVIDSPAVVSIIGPSDSARSFTVSGLPVRTAYLRC
jgi:hypothetical protein